MQGISLNLRFMDASDWWRLGLAFVVFPLLGGIASGLWVLVTRRPASVSSTISDFKNGFLIGILERVFFVALIGFGVAGSGVAMIGWVSAKMVAGWNQYSESTDPNATADEKDRLFERVKNLRMTGLSGGLISMLFALIGGLILGGRINL